jgi:hypothetical protein
VELGDGWMPARINFATFSARIEYLHKLCQQADKPMVKTAVMPFTSIAKDQESALAGIDVSGLIDEAHNISLWAKPASGRFSTLEDIAGVILAGSPADIVRQSRVYEESGANHIVYDLRLRFSDWVRADRFIGS